VTLTAKEGVTAKTFDLKLLAAVRTLTAGTTEIAFGDVVVGTTETSTAVFTSTGTVPAEITSATPFGTGITVSGATFPVTLDPGAKLTLSVHFAPTATGAVTGKVTIASNASSSATKLVTVTGTGAAATLRAVTCSYDSLAGPSTDTCEVGLDGPAPSGGLIVSLASNNTAVKVPLSVKVAAKATSASFTATVSAESVAQKVNLTAKAGAIAKSVSLDVLAADRTLSIGTTSVAFGNVAVNTTATQDVTFKSTGSLPVTIGGATLSGADFTASGVTLPTTLKPGQSVTAHLQFKPAATGAVTGKITITSNATSDATSVIDLSGTGTAYQVDLKWEAPTSSADPVAGYKVLRAIGGSSNYTGLNSTVITQTSYLDATVQSGVTYEYVVESVSDDGASSGPSNAIEVTIP
jgi:fibronectin type 3 domain-containing protein